MGSTDGGVKPRRGSREASTGGGSRTRHTHDLLSRFCSFRSLVADCFGENLLHAQEGEAAVPMTCRGAPLSRLWQGSFDANSHQFVIEFVMSMCLSLQQVSTLNLCTYQYEYVSVFKIRRGCLSPLRQKAAFCVSAQKPTGSHKGCCACGDRRRCVAAAGSSPPPPSSSLACARPSSLTTFDSLRRRPSLASSSAPILSKECLPLTSCTEFRVVERERISLVPCQRPSWRRLVCVCVCVCVAQSRQDAKQREGERE